jgi:hypothetical protein
MGEPLSEVEAGRLTLIAFIHQQAEATAALTYPRSAPAILLLHDTVELFLGLVAGHLDADIPSKIQFTEYWSLIDRAPGAAGRRLGSRGRMDALNSARVGFKHHGSVPSADTVRRSVESVRGFITATCQLMLGVDYADVDLVDLVPQSEVRELLKEARRCQRENDIGRGVDAVAVAFGRLIRAASGTRGVRALMGTGTEPRLGRIYERNPRSAGRATEEAAALYATQKAVNALTQAVEPMRDGLRLLGMGIDLTEYGQFMARVPRVSETMGQTDVVTHPTGYTPTSEDIDFGVQFVITAALHIADEPPIQKMGINEAWAGISVHRYPRGALASGATGDMGELPPADGVADSTEPGTEAR